MHSSPNTVINISIKEEVNKEEFILSKLSKREVKDIELKNDILVSGIDNIKVSLANCCKPVKGDKIVGYISRGNGVIVHTKNCYNLRHMDDRIIDVSWNKEQVQKYKTNISIVSEKLENVLLDIITKTNNLNISITKVDTKQKENETIFNLIVEVDNIDTLNKYMTLLKQNSSIISVERIMN